MCGLVGMLGNIQHVDKKALRDLLLFDTVRGVHSTGVISVNPKNEYTMAKEVGLPDRLFEYDCFDDKGMLNLDSKLVIGHNRAATRGAVNAKNAHPFLHGDTAGAHNGTLDKSCIKDLEGGSTFDVDSEALINTVDLLGLKDSIEKVEGAYALTLYDFKDQVMTFLRNDKRTLFYCWNTVGDTMYWASEAWMLMAALGRNGIKHDDPQLFETDIPYTINVKSKFLTKKDMLEKGEKLECLKPKTTFRGNGYQYAHNTNNGHRTYSPHYKSNSTVVGSKIFSKQISNKLKGKCVKVKFEGKLTKSKSNLVYRSGECDEYPDIQFREYVPEGDSSKASLGLVSVNAIIKKVKRTGSVTYAVLDRRTIVELVSPKEEEVETPHLLRASNGIYISLKEWLERTKDGCAECSASSDPVMSEYYGWTANQEYLCECCTQTSEYKSMITFEPRSKIVNVTKTKSLVLVK